MPRGLPGLRRVLPDRRHRADARGLALDLGRCLFCTDCIEACPEGAIRFTHDYRMATRNRSDLVVRGGVELALAEPLDARMRRLFGRSLKLRQVSAGGDNAEESDLNVLGTIVFDMGRFGIQFVASPRHADGLVITGPVTRNMTAALLNAYESVPSPKLVIVVGAAAISGGPFRGHPEVEDGADGLLPIDLYIPGFPPHPMTILDGFLRLLGRLEGMPERIRPEGLAVTPPAPASEPDPLAPIVASTAIVAEPPKSS